MTVTDTPDWVNPLPGGAHTILNDGFNLLVSGGQYVSAWLDVTAFNGLYIETNGFDLATDFGSLEVQYRDAAGVQPIFPKYDAFWRGDLRVKVNVPVLGAQARIVITGPAHNVNAQIVVVGHGGGGSSSYRNQARLLVSLNGVSVPASSSTYFVGSEIAEGPAYYSVRSTSQGPWYGNLWCRDSVGNRIFLAGTSHMQVGDAVVIPIWLPPQMIEIEVENDSTVAGNFYGGLMLGRT